MAFFNRVRHPQRSAGLIGLLICGVFPQMTGSAAAEDLGKFYYGKKAGMTVTILSKEGIGTANAVMRIKHTENDAKAVCVKYELDYSARCVRRAMATTKVKDRVTGNCVERTWTDTYGDRYSFHGSARQAPEMLEKMFLSEDDYLIRRAGDEDFLADAGVTFYAEVLDIFQSLCPGIAR